MYFSSPGILEFFWSGNSYPTITEIQGTEYPMNV